MGDEVSIPLHVGRLGVHVTELEEQGTHDAMLELAVYNQHEYFWVLPHLNFQPWLVEYFPPNDVTACLCDWNKIR